jgi:nucleotide-binding universal stress UspA family protein
VRVPTLILGPAARPFVDPANGRAGISRILVPVDHDPDPTEAVSLLEQIAGNLGAELDFVHVGSEPPALPDGRGRPRTLQGPVVETLLAEASGVNLVAMPMAWGQWPRRRAARQHDRAHRARGDLPRAGAACRALEAAARASLPARGRAAHR